MELGVPRAGVSRGQYPGPSSWHSACLRPPEWPAMFWFCLFVCILPVTLRNIPGGETESLGLRKQVQCCFQLKYPLGNLRVFNVIIMENRNYKRK